MTITEFLPLTVGVLVILALFGVMIYKLWSWRNFDRLHQMRMRCFGNFSPQYAETVEELACYERKKMMREYRFEQAMKALGIIR